ncbi:MAG: GWxTD domain-containing protein [Bryobacterales bacterium]|nr:GWxTD domain-containing protein [Bryobacterales bacterium]
MSFNRLIATSGLFLFTVGGGIVLAQDAQQAPSQTRETVARPLSEKDRRKRLERLRKELETPYKRWLDEDVAYVITDEERQAFKRLATDEEREQFVEQFWRRRDPTPDSVENEYKEEHYRRIAYANERFASGFPGWKSDRGRIYITFGPPDEIEDHPSGGSYVRPWEEGGGTTSTYPFQKWRYRYIDGIGTDVMIEFVDTSMTGEFRMTMDPSEKDALLHVPGAGLTWMEEMGMASKADRFSRTDGTRLGTGDQPLPQRMNQFERLQQFAMLQKPPEVKFKDLEATVDSRITYNTLPMVVRSDYFRVTNSSVMTNVTVLFQNHDLQFKAGDGIQKAIVNIYGRITSMSRRPINVFEDVVSVEAPNGMLEDYVKKASIYQKSIPLPPGRYRLNIVAKDITAGTVNNFEMALDVPYFQDEVLSSSSVVLADMIEKVPSRSAGAGQFVIGTSKIRPRITDSFKQNEKLGIYVQLYNFTPDEASKKFDATIHYEVKKLGSDETIFTYDEKANTIENASSSQVIVEKVLPLNNFEPGTYEIKMKVTDNVTKEVLTPTATFKVTS